MQSLSSNRDRPTGEAIQTDVPLGAARAAFGEDLLACGPPSPLGGRMEEGVGQREEEQCVLGKREKSCAVRCTRLHVPVGLRSSASIRTVHPRLGSRAGEGGECPCAVAQIDRKSTRLN